MLRLTKFFIIQLNIMACEILSLFFQMVEIFDGDVLYLAHKLLLFFPNLMFAIIILFYNIFFLFLAKYFVCYNRYLAIRVFFSYGNSVGTWNFPHHNRFLALRDLVIYDFRCTFPKKFNISFRILVFRKFSQKNAPLNQVWLLYS